MKKVNLTMREIIKAVLEYEYNSGFYGLQESIYTADIIELESKKLAKVDIKVDSNVIYTFCKDTKLIELRLFDNLEKAKEYAYQSFNEVYIVYQNKIWAVQECDNNIEMYLVWNGMDVSVKA